MNVDICKIMNFTALCRRFNCLLRLIEPSAAHIESYLSAIATGTNHIKIGQLETGNYLV